MVGRGCLIQVRMIGSVCGIVQRCEINMAELKPMLKRLVPQALWKPASDLYWWWRNRGQHVAGAAINPRRRKSVQALAGFHNLHQGQRCFILGNGPSLRKTDLSLLEGEVTFGMNRIYLLFPEMGFSTTYFVSINTLVLEQCAEDIRGRYSGTGDAEVCDLAQPPVAGRRSRGDFSGYRLHSPGDLLS